MSEVVVYHGGTEPIATPICKFGRPNLDFGQGFYVTNLREQAVAWANNMAHNRQQAAMLNRYLMNREAILQNMRCKVFEAYDAEWLEFIVGNRGGQNPAEDYDYIEGGVANDRVVDTVNLYTVGLMDLNTALRELSKHQPNNQMCILNQEIISKYFVYDGTESL